MDNIVAVIPARGGSKGIPRKNLQDLGGKPLIAWPIELALSVGEIDRVVVSTEDEEIAEVSKKYGAQVPFVRPLELAQDETLTRPVLEHAVEYLEENENYKAEIILLLYATTPFMRHERILEALRLFDEEGCNSVMGVMKQRERVWNYNRKRGRYVPLYPKKRTNRQFVKPLLKEAGNIFFTKYETLMNGEDLIDDESVEFVFVEEEECLDIDDMNDLKQARQRVKRL